MNQANPTVSAPIISVIILNYNGAKWIKRCLDSLASQTIYSQIEVIVADNFSSDGSDRTAEEILKSWSNGLFIQHGKNLGFCEGNNRAVPPARGEYLFFLNNDTWLEPDCLEKLLAGTRSLGASASTPLVLNYDDDSHQIVFGIGFDIFGLTPLAEVQPEIRELFMPPGCSFLVETKLFKDVGAFDSTFFLYSDELDLCWRIWIAGKTCAAVQTARLHHRLAANVNPQGGARIVEFRTSDSKRFYTNRNGLLVLIKDAQHILLLLVFPQFGLLVAETLVFWAFTRRWSYVQRTFIGALRDCWRLRHHILAERRRIAGFRRRSDWWMLRFFTWRLRRWYELKHLQFGLPKITRD